MANDISKRNETLPSTETTNSYLAYANSVASSRIVGKLLKFTKFGEFVAGEENADVPMGTELIVHGEEMHIGWQKWEDSRPVDHIMGRMCDGFIPPKRHELGDTDQSLWEVDDKGKARDPWQESAYTIMYDPKTQQIYTFATSSKGGHKANGTIAKAYYTRSRMTPDMFPVIQLDWYEYDHRDRSLGKIRNPQFNIIGWTQCNKINEALQAAAGEAAAQAEADQEAADYYDEVPSEYSNAVKTPYDPVSTGQAVKEALRAQEVNVKAQQRRDPHRTAEQRATAAETRQPQPQPQPQSLSGAARKPRF